MSLIPHRFLPRSMFDMDLWGRPEHLGFGPSTLDLFDPFDELDHMIGRNFLWLNKPDFLNDWMPRAPRVPEKYRISVDCRGFNAQSIKTEISKDKSKLVVTGREEDDNKGSDDYSLKEFRKTYKLPPNAQTDKMASFFTSNGQLIIEIPLQVKENEDDLFPRVINDENGKKNVEMKISVPNNIDPTKIKVTCKDRDVIIQAEDKVEKPDGISKMSYYRRTTLPPNTDFNSLKCVFDNNRLSLKASLNTDFNNTHKNIPIEMNNKQNNSQK